jgi:hypothetical protein
MEANAFKTVSEWVKAGNMATGLHLIGSKVVRETAKAFGVECLKINSCGNLKPAVCWFPKSKVASVQDDFYTHKSASNILVPGWLVSAKMAEGFEF